ncbi:Crp/Fnr family transcriptional regulator [Antarctobacter jejuensis]|uniref:Crp/Fnr family transcriptional regulator n=1 Tax=Antarctobacter jejuensis TaxID=1439938 RepID=UPI003FD3E23E
MTTAAFTHPIPLGLCLAETAPPAFRDTLAALGSRIHLDAGADLFRQGDDADAIYVLEDGAMEVSILSEDGHKLTLNFLGAGTIFGEIALVDGGPRSATVSAVEACTLLRISKADFLTEIRSNPQFAVDMIQVCIERLRWVSGQLEAHVFHPLPVRLARRLLYLIDTRAQGNALPMSQSEMAAHVGVTREAVTKVLSVWKKAGIVSQGRGHITVLDRSALEDFAATGHL